MCGTLNAATARLVSLVGQALQTGAFEGTGIHSPEQWWHGGAGCRAAELAGWWPWPGACPSWPTPPKPLFSSPAAVARTPDVMPKRWSGPDSAEPS